MSNLLANLRQFGQHHGLFGRETSLVAAVSGGPDSLAMLHGLVALRSELHFTLQVAHLNHGLRGAEATADADFVAATAQQWGLPCTIVAVDVAALASEYSLNLYAAGRAARYALFAQVATTAPGTQAVAVAHTADDQAETLLMHLLRGAGPAGLSGIRPVLDWREWQQFGKPLHVSTATDTPTPQLIRPLLTTTRQEIMQYCALHGLAPRNDPANADIQHLRSRVRHTLIPQLIEYNPQIIAALGRTAEISAQQEDFLAMVLEQAWADLVVIAPYSVTFLREAWNRLHPVIQSAALRKAYLLVGGSDTLAQADLERARAAAQLRVGKRVELPGGVTVTVIRAGFVFGQTPHAGNVQHTS
jgi:tRNA(Ile)-lysidine synthetase-like protein